MSNEHDSLPLVSVIITSYNREKYISETINSVLLQDYKNLEIVISDNASTDNTDLLIRKYLHDKKIKYFRNESNIGMIANFKLATERANGKYITYLSSDDYFINNSFISESVSLINKYNNVLLVLGRYTRFYEDTKKTEIDQGGIFNKQFIKGNDLFLQFPHIKTVSWAAALMHRETFLGLNPFEKPCTAMDVLSNLKLMLLGNVALINKASYMHRIHDGIASLGINIEQAIDNFIYITEPYNTALENSIIPKKKLDKWKTDSAFLYARSISVQFAPQSKTDYHRFIAYVKANFPGVYQKLRLNFKWNILIFFFKRPALSLKFLNIVSKDHYMYLKHLIDNGNNRLFEKVKL
ncbi:MAG: glycosyltransferase family 2 protein [Ginsengibacter sp.]